MNIMLCDLEHSNIYQDFGYCRSIKFEEIICKMSKGRVTKAGEFLVKLWNSDGKTRMEWLVGLLNVIFRA